MALDFEQSKQLEKIKADHKTAIVDKQLEVCKEEHKLKMERLEKLLEIAKAGNLTKPFNDRGDY